MRKNNKGFTLIELLAVIVILAIIALITAPIILNVIENARVEAAKDKAWGTIDAVKLAYAQDQTSNAGDNQYELGQAITFDEDGFAEVGETQVKASGEMPSGGTVTINQDGSISATDLVFGGKYHCSTQSADSVDDDDTNNMVCSKDTSEIRGAGN